MFVTQKYQLWSKEKLQNINPPKTIRKKINDLENKVNKLAKGFQVLANVFTKSNIPLKTFDKKDFKEILKEININIESSKTERSNLFNNYQIGLRDLKWKFLEKSLVLIADSSRIRGKNYTIMIISDFDNPENFDLLNVHVGYDTNTTENFIKVLKNSLVYLKKVLII